MQSLAYVIIFAGHPVVVGRPQGMFQPIRTGFFVSGG
jgi:hypothetical protein